MKYQPSMRLIILATFFYAVNLFAMTDLPEKNYGPSRGRIPYSYYEKISSSLNDLSEAKEMAKLAIGYFLDDESPLPKNIAGIFRDEKGNDSPALYRSHEGGDDLMWALLQIYKNYPDDKDAQNFYQRVIQFADLMLAHGTDRYGAVTSPLLASILTRDFIPKIPEDPENPGNGVRVERHTVYSFSKGEMRENWCAVGVGNIWYGSDESHKSSWRGTDMAQDEKLYELLYELSDVTSDPKYKDAANASITFWLANCPSEANLFPWGEHAGWDFFADEYDKGYYRSIYHEFKGGETLYDKFIELQPRIRNGELTVIEKYALAHVPTGTGKIRNGSQAGVFVYGRHQPLWTDRENASEAHPDLLEFGNFPRIPGSWLYLQAIAYNRSNNRAFKDAVITDMNIIADGLEQQRSILGIDFYPFQYPVMIDGTIDDFENRQNDKLNESARKAIYLLQQSQAPSGTINRIATIADFSGSDSPISVASYHGPAMVTSVSPAEGSSVNTTVSLSWTSSQGANSYNVYLAEGNDSELRLASSESTSYLGNTNSNSWRLSRLEMNRNYYWVVDAVGDKGIRKGEILFFNTGQIKSGL